MSGGGLFLPGFIQVNVGKLKVGLILYIFIERTLVVSGLEKNYPMLPLK